MGATTAAAEKLSLSAPLRKVMVGVVLFLFILIVAICGYVIAGWRVSDAIYMVVITIFGVGYGEVRPIESPQLRALTMVVIVAGYGAVLYTIGGFMQLLIDGELNRAIGARRMTKEIGRLRGHTIICGAGRLGTMLAGELHEAGKPFVIIDNDAQRLADLDERGILYIQGDATEEETLQQAEIAHAAMVATVLSSDATNVFVTITARGLNSDVQIIARAEHPRSEKKLLGSGANQVVLPTAIGAKKVAQMVIRPTAENMLDHLHEAGSNMLGDLEQLGLNLHEFAVPPDSPLVNHEMADIEVRGNHGFLIVGLRRADGTSLVNPPPSTRLVAGDTVVVLGHGSDMPEIAKRFQASVPKMSYRGVST